MLLQLLQFRRNLQYLIIIAPITLLLATCSSPRGENRLQISPSALENSPSPITHEPSLTETPTPATPTVVQNLQIQPSPTPTGMAEFELHKVEDDLGEMHSLWVDPSGKLWTGTSQGIFIPSDHNWESIYQGGVERIIGAGMDGVVWVILDGESRIAAFDRAGTGQFFGVEQGWTEPADIAYLSPGYGDGLATDHQGRVWIATGRDDIRAYDPQRNYWSVLSAVDIGYAPAGASGYQGHFLNDVELSANQEIWAADCMGEGESLKGQGIRWSDGDNWFDIPDTAGECVQDMEIDSQGKMWVAGFDALLMYDPALANWTRFPLPSWDRRQLVSEIDLDAHGSPWVEVIRSGGAGPIGDVVRYYLEDGEWYQVFNGWFSSLAFTKSGEAWLCSEGNVFQFKSGQLEKVGEIPGTSCDIKADGFGRFWVTNFSKLWWFDSAN